VVIVIIDLRVGMYQVLVDEDVNGLNDAAFAIPHSAFPTPNSTLW